MSACSSAAPGPIDELDAQECRRLLGSTSVGRPGYASPRRPRIVPPNDAVLPDAGTFASSEIARHAVGASVALEADAVDEFLHDGCRVLVTAGLGELGAEESGRLDASHTTEPWAAGERDLFCSSGVAASSGRLVLPG